MTDTADQPLVAFPVRRTCPYDPPPQYRRWREETPISRVRLPSGASAWVLTRHKDVRAMLTDPRFGSDRRHPGYPSLRADRQVGNETDPSLVGMDPPEHTAARRALLGEFTVKRVQGMRLRIQQIVDGCLDAMFAAKGEGAHSVDLVRMLALPVPSLVICDLLGVPYADHEFFQTRSRLLVARTTSREELNRANDELMSYLDNLVAVKEEAGSDDLLGRQIVKQRASGRTDHEALVSLAFLLLVVGHETTANMISLGTLALLENPGQLDAIRVDAAKTPQAVEELVRYFTVAEFATSRVALSDVEIGGVLIRAGEGVIGLGNAANRDPDAFEYPDDLNIDRDARHHVAFGYGAHQCIAQNLARAELQIVFDTLFRRIPGLRLAKPVEELAFKHDSGVYGLHDMPVTW